MLTKNEITSLSLSPTKKDFVQIWNELLEVAGKLSERWDPTSTNESDPGIVILKALTGIADKLNYNIDKNTLEAFMPTAAQEDSMRKLCDMLGYSIKYYRSAETSVTIKYSNSDTTESDADSAATKSWLIPKFTVIKNSDQDISYFTTNQTPLYISTTTPAVTINCMEGQVVKCESIVDNNVITSAQLSENNRFYLPETQIAENGIFVYNVYSSGGAGLEDGTPWERVDNLNIQARGERVFKFGYDSYASRPYIEFPSDYSELINDGLFIYYTRTSGANGNISHHTLTQLEMPSDWEDVSADNFTVTNTFAATSGANVETIKQAYNNFKKTIGTFETLVTCRDYMNKIYTLTNDVGKNYVSNILVTDIRNDLNRAVTICSCDSAGIFYKETPLTVVTTKELKLHGDTSEVVKVDVEEPAINHFDLVLYPFKSYSQINSNVTNIQTAYDSSFKYNAKSFNEVKSVIENANIKTIAHSLNAPRENDIISINNYLRLSAVIGTNSKITVEEGELLKEKIKIALANAFNMRELDFGEEIPFDSLLEVIEKSDPRIKVVSLNEPAVYTTFSVFEGLDSTSSALIREYAVASDWLTEAEADATGRFEYTKNDQTISTFNTKKAKQLYNKLVVRNILAGRIPLFKYNTTFKTSFSECAYRITEEVNITEELPSEIITELIPTEDNPITIWADGKNIYTGQLVTSSDNPEAEAETVYTKTFVPDEYKNNIITAIDDNNITEITTNCEIRPGTNADGTPAESISDVELASGEFIRFRAPNFITKKTYPAYVNYHLALANDIAEPAVEATAYNLFSLLNGDITLNPDKKGPKWNALFDDSNINRFATARKREFALTQAVLLDDTTDESGKLVIENPGVASTEETPSTILVKSGCIRLKNEGVPTFRWRDAGTAFTNEEIASLAWADDVQETTPPATRLSILLSDSSWIITNSDTFATIQANVNEVLANLKPLEADWTISYNFEYIPFEASTLVDWSNFVNANSYDLFGFEPKKENGVILWRAYGEGYTIGKYVMENTSKLLPFTSNYFGLLNNLSTRLLGIYIAKDLGKDQKSNFIKNNEEYKLREGEYLYIEYTPSTTAEDGTTQTGDAVKEIYGAGTIIRPNGFETGIVDSSAYETLGHSPFKTITFGTLENVNMHSFGANEQVEIRDYARVELNKDTFSNSSTIYVYKNFNNCPELETIPNDGTGYVEHGKRQKNTYTLKDGEYILYTDANKSEYAYLTSGTEVTLTGKVVIPEMDIIDLAVLLDAGPEDIPWYPIPLTTGDSIILQEYQYVTLGQGDKLKNLDIVVEGDQKYLSSNWLYCDNVKYIPSGSEEESSLAKINTYGSDTKGCGWEASSVLELNASPNNSQTLRTTNKVKTSITLHKSAASGVGNTTPITIEAIDANHPISFKTNLACQSSNGKLTIEDVTNNPDKLDSFALKIFTEQSPSILKTKTGTVIPGYTATNEYIDITTWETEKPYITKGYSELWNRVLLTELESKDPEYEYAVKIPVSLLPNTYGIFSIYLDYEDTNEEYKRTWIEMLPGLSQDTIRVLNTNTGTTDSGRLMLEPGLTCLRVDATCDLYIKTANGSSGTLCFDELRLVDIKPLSYVAEGQLDTYVTYGFNLDQLGYFDVSDEVNFLNAYDAETRKQLKTTATNTAVNKIAEISAANDEELITITTALKKVQPDLQAIVAYLTSINNELDTLAARDLDKIKDSLEAYITLHEDLSNEYTLRDALTNSAEIEKLDELNALLKSFGVDITEGQSSLLLDLKTWLDTVNSKIDNLSKLIDLDVTNEFELAADLDLYPGLIANLKAESLTTLNKSYTTALKNIATQLNDLAISNEPAQDVIKQALKNLYLNKYNELFNQVTTLIAESQLALNASLEAAKITANGELKDKVYEVAYNDVATHLYAAREQIINFEITTLLNKINVGTAEDVPETLAQYITELKTLLTSEDSELITKLDSLILKVQNKINTGSVTTDPDIQTSISSIQVSTAALLTTEVNTLLDKITELVSSVSDYTSIVESLNAVTSETVKELLNSLTELIEARTDSLKLITDFGTKEDFNIKVDYIDLPKYETVVPNVWLDYMKGTLTDEVRRLYTITYLIARTLTATEPPDTLTIGEKIAGNNLFKSIITTQIDDTSTIYDLYERAKELALAYLQETTRKEQIDKLAELIPADSDLVNAMATIKISDRTAIICSIIHELTNTTDILKKGQLYSELEIELAKVIDFDRQLLEINAQIVCPSILLYDSLLPEAAFYATLRDTVKGKKDSLIGIDVAQLTDTTALTNLKIDPQNINELTESVVADSVITNISRFTTEAYRESLKELLPSYFIDYLPKTEAKLAKKALINNVNSCKLLTILQQNIIAAWETADGRWTDSTGRNFVPYETDVWADDSGYWQLNNDTRVKVTVKRNKAREWFDCATNEQIVIKVDDAWVTADGTLIIEDDILNRILQELYELVYNLGQSGTVAETFKEAYNALKLEIQLLDEIRKTDVNRSFYYNVPVEASLALEFNESDNTLNTLRNPHINYDINNVNNSFVISKLDIDYLTKGLQIARSSRIN